MKYAIVALALVASPANAQLFPCGIFDPSCERQNASDHAACVSYGAKIGTPEYISCRTQLRTSHDARRAIIGGAIIASPDPQPYRPR